MGETEIIIIAFITGSIVGILMTFLITSPLKKNNKEKYNDENSIFNQSEKNNEEEEEGELDLMNNLTEFISKLKTSEVGYSCYVELDTLTYTGSVLEKGYLITIEDFSTGISTQYINKEDF